MRDHPRARDRGPAQAPEPDRWSTLGYGCHPRDVRFVQRERVLRAWREGCPVLAPTGRDDQVAHDGYLEQDPADVARQLRGEVGPS